MSDWLVPGTELTVTIAEALWAARGMWANLIILVLVWRLTFHTREVALYFRSRRLLSEQRHLLSVASRLADQFGSSVNDDPRADADLEKRLRKVQDRLRRLDRMLGWSSLERAPAR
jgi:hypothetical protein